MSRGHTLPELLTVMALAAIVAAVTVPGVAWVTGRAAPGADARSFALVLRRAQAAAAASGAIVSVRLIDQGLAYECDQAGAAGPVAVDRGVFHETCSSNYPGDVVQFGPWGWPCAQGGRPRAGSFTFTRSGATATVVLQMGGRVRWQ